MQVFQNDINIKQQDWQTKVICMAYAAIADNLWNSTWESFQMNRKLKQTQYLLI